MAYIRIFTALFLFVITATAQAHEGRPLYIEVTEQTAANAGKILLRWRIPPVLRPSEIPVITVSGQGCSDTASIKTAALTGARTVNCSAQTAGLAVNISYPGINPALSSLVVVKRQDGSTFSIFSGPEISRIALPAEDDFWAVAGQYITAGFDHILSGYDHLLFVFCLLLLAGSLRRVFFTVTGFTLGHSVTLALSVLGGWSLPPTFVEPLIAFSILILAAEIARGSKESLTYRHPVLIAASFGLLHGFGFAGALAELGLPSSLKIPALAFFNVGVELGQIAFVLAVYGFYLLCKALLRRTKTAAPLPFNTRYAVYPAGMLAAFWTLERLASL